MSTDSNIYDHNLENNQCLAKKIQNINVWDQNVIKIVVGGHNVEKNQCLR